MKKYFLLFLVALFAISCSKKIEITGKISNANPDERIEIIEASGVASLPIVNVPVDKDGNFVAKFDAPSTGMYVITYAGNENLIFLHKGDKLNLNGNGKTFPKELSISGDAKADNDFFQATQKFIQNYAPTVDVNGLLQKDEKSMIAGINKIEASLNRNIEESEKKYKPSKEVVEWKKIDVNSTLLSILGSYQGVQIQLSGNPNLKVGKGVTDYINRLESNQEEMVKINPTYRNYLINKETADFQKFAESKTKGNTVDIPMTKLFAEYLAPKKEYSQVIKDYLLAFAIAQADIRPGVEEKSLDAANKLIEESIKDKGVKDNLKGLMLAVNGIKPGEVAPEVTLKKQDDKSYKFTESKGKPTLVMFYASWNPFIAESTISVLKEVTEFYKSKMNFVHVSVDDTKEGFIKGNNSLLKGIPGINVYADNGLNSDVAKKFGLYAFRLPSFVVLDKEGKIASRPYFNLGDPQLVEILDKQTGLKAPQVNPNIQLQNDLLTPPPPPVAEAPANKTETK